jgi:hypothetical protein
MYPSAVFSISTPVRLSTLQDCAARKLVVDIAKELPVAQRTRTDSRGRELNLVWSLPWQQVHVQMPWLSCQRSTPSEAAVLQAAKAVWGRGPVAAAAGSSTAGPSSQQQQRRQLTPPSLAAGSGGRMAAVVAAMSAEAAGVRPQQDDNAVLPFMQQPPPPPPPAAAKPQQKPPGSVKFSFSAGPSTSSAAGAAAEPAGDSSSSSSAAVSYQDGPLMLFVDTSAFLSMLGCPGNVASGTCLTLKLLQALAGSGRFGRGE